MTRQQIESSMNNIVEQAHALAKRDAREKTMTLGEIIFVLEKCDPTHNVWYAFGSLRPDGLDSYRGVYSQLALGYAEEGDPVNVADLLKECKEAVGKTFTGYKGGDFVMDKSTPVWISNYGKASETGIDRIVGDKYNVKIFANEIED